MGVYQQTLGDVEISVNIYVIAYTGALWQVGGQDKLEILSIRVRSIKSTNLVQFHIPLVRLKRNAMTHGMTYCNVMFVYSCVDEKNVYRIKTGLVMHLKLTFIFHSL